MVENPPQRPVARLPLQRALRQHGQVLGQSLAQPLRTKVFLAYRRHREERQRHVEPVQFNALEILHQLVKRVVFPRQRCRLAALEASKELLVVDLQKFVDSRERFEVRARVPEVGDVEHGRCVPDDLKVQQFYVRRGLSPVEDVIPYMETIEGV